MRFGGAIENVEVACGIPILMQGYNSEDIARGIDEHMFRQPVGVAAVICPFNFPGMIPFWFMPYALACGNTYLVKPSEKVPLTMQTMFRLIEQRFPPRSRELDQRRTRGRGRHPGSPGDPRGQLCRLHGRGEICLQPRDRERQARPVPGRGQESRRRIA